MPHQMPPSTCQSRFVSHLLAGTLAFLSFACGTEAQDLCDLCPDAIEIVETGFQPEGQFRVRLVSDDSHYYLLWRGETPDNAYTPCDVQLSGGKSTLLEDKAPSPTAGFYRIVRLPLSGSWDSDNDGMPDVYELNHRPLLSPLDPKDATEDPDGDGRSNLTEYLANSDPSHAEPDEGVSMALRRFAAGSDFSAAIRTDGSLWTWGGNASGQLGNGTRVSSDRPVQVGTNTDWNAISAGGGFLVALRLDGTLWTWGGNSHGQLGDGTLTDRLEPVQIAAGDKWKAIATGRNHALAIREDGTLWGWGGSDLPSPGIDNTFTPTPTQISADTDWASVTTAENTLALKADGTLWGWNSSDDRSLAVSVRIGSDSDWRYVSGNFGIRRDGSLWRWDAVNLDHLQYLRRYGNLTGWRAVDSRLFLALACRADGTVWAEGPSNAAGQLGIGIQTAVYELKQSEVDGCVGVAIGDYHSLALRADGTLLGFGANSSGQLGHGTNTFRLPQRVGGETNWISVASGEYHTVALRADGSLWTWGLNTSGQLGVGYKNNLDRQRFSPQRLGTNTNWRRITAGDYHTAALQADGSLWAWGANGGRIGNGTVGAQATPVAVQPQIIWNSLSAGGLRTMALRPDGSLWAWGIGDFGLGDGTKQTMISPVQIGTNLNWTEIQIGGAHAMGLQNDGRLWGWGYNGSGCVGNGSTDTQLKPVVVAPDDTWKAVALDGTSTMAIRSDGSLWAWGNNSNGQLGDGTTVSRLRPVRIGSETNWVTIAMGELHSLAIRADGTLWSWGANFDGQLGIGGKLTFTPITIPTQVGTDTGWKAIAGGEYHSVALREDGTMWTWGRATDGQLGLFAASPVLGGAVWGNPRP